MQTQWVARRVAWGAYALALVAFVVAGAGLVPFHGDESIWIYMSHDFDDLFVRRDVSRLLYSADPADPEDQSLRELNNPIAKYVVSLSWRAAGYTDADLNGYWVWGAGWDWNAENGRVPSASLLRAARWLPAALAALGVLAVMALGVRLGGSRTRAGWLAAALLATDASFLLHTRRAMAEGTLIAFGTLSIALTVAYLGRLSSDEPNPVWARAAYLVGIGTLTGLAVATKLNGAIVAMVVALALVAWRPWRALRVRLVQAGQVLTRASADVIVVGALALAVVLALSPFLWVNPLARVRDTLRDMNALVAAQNAGRARLETPGQRVGALLEQVFWTPPAYLVGIGTLTGLAVATKLNGAIVAMVVALALVAWRPWRALRVRLVQAGQVLTRASADVIVVGALALAVVLALSPFLWVNPLARVRDTLRDMNALVAAQNAGRARLETPGQRVGALVEQVFWTPPAYYEDAIWGEWVSAEIVRYEGSPLAGWRRPPWARLALGAAFVVGLVWLLAWRPTDPARKVARGVVLAWLGVTTLVNLLIIPFAWQRYYVTLWPGVALVQAVGLVTVGDGMRRIWDARSGASTKRD